MIEVRKLALEGVLEITPRRFGDRRGFFSETYNAAEFADAGIDLVFVQDNHSLSAAAGVLRGLHYQLPPFAQDKLLRVPRGAIIDIAVDVRKSSPSFGRWVAIEISAEKWNQILVPAGYAHGFVTLVEDTEVIYKVTQPYMPASERVIRYDDPQLAIDWGVSAAGITLSDRDRAAPFLADAELFE
jgi:dTDP-4-dehydrorhamnose 3,5-epimerase